ncbi:MAG: SpoIIE family protein phosphatase [Planctomycetota bacterium]
MTRSRRTQAGESSRKSGGQRPQRVSYLGDAASAQGSDSGLRRVSGAGEEQSDSVQTGAPRMKPVGLPLRTKFLLVMSGLTATAMITLGIILSMMAHRSLFNQAKHKGIELTKMTAQVGRVLLDWSRETGGRDREWLHQKLTHYLGNATRWGEEDGTYSNIDLVEFDGGDLSALFYGNSTGDTSKREPYQTSVYIPREGKVRLEEDIRFYGMRKVLESGNKVPVYRYRVKLNHPTNDDYTENTVVVDVRSDTIHEVSRNLFVIVAVAVLAVIGLVVYSSNLLARRITRPVRLLMRDIQAVAKGDFDHRTKAHSKDEIGVLANEFNRMTQDLKVAQSALVEREKAQYELNIAHEVQQQLLPAEIPQIPGYDLSAFYKGAAAVSGDYYDVFSLGDGLWGLIVADVSGKGVPGSMVMAVTRTIVRLVAQKHLHNAAETLKETNRLIAKQIKRGMFVTAFYAVLEQHSGRLLFASAGHNPMVIYRAAQRGYELAQPKGIAIGFNEGPLFDKTIQEFQTNLAPGDAIALYTDGFPEAMNERNEEFGDDRFHQCVARYGQYPAQDMIRGVLGELTKHRGRAAQSDDLTIIVVKRS